jgi:hypothetical protein
MSEFTAAHTQATYGVMQDDPASVSAAWGALLSEYGYDVAAAAWRAACQEADR